MTPAGRTVVLTTIPFQCPSCLRHLRMAAALAGRLARCPAFRGMVRVPGEAGAPAEVRGDDPTVPLRPSPDTTP